MKKFEKPFCEVVHFKRDNVLTSGCGCWDGDIDTGEGTDCTGDVAYCACKVNYNPAQDNCTPCATNQGA